MVLKNWLIAASGALALGTGVYCYSAQAAIPERCEVLPNLESKADCACEWALQEKSTVAIEEFLAKYGSEDTACNALAQFPQPGFDNDRVEPPQLGSGT